DHRINLTSYSIDKVMNGEFAEFVDALRQEEMAALLAEAE
ncbi:MAG: peptide chain release factor 1, partial [Gluconacetobacter diazotrophicus]|nr:peptide chain release factor 1 [Gluconacetobacter diazotrophicus]